MSITQGRILSGMFLLAQCAAIHCAEGEAEKMKPFEGEWVMISGERGGQSLPDAAVKMMRRVVKGSEVTVTMGGAVYFSATFSVNPSAAPKAIDYVLTGGPGAGKTQLGIYELKDGKLTLCFADAGKERPAEFSSENGALLTTWKPADKKAAPVTAEKMSADEVKLPPPPKSNGQSLGEAAEIALGVANLKDALAFYERLGVKKLSQSGGEHPSATLTDGSIIVTLNPGQTPALLLVYYAADMDQRIEELEKLGIVFDSKREGEAVFSDPNGLHVKLVKADASKLPKPAGKPFSKCGMFGELCVSTRDLKASLAFWDKAGFGKTHSESAPYPFAIVMDGKLIVGLHQGNAEIKAPTLTYFDRDSKARIAELKKAGVAFESEKGGGVLKSPDGQGVFLFNW